MRTGAILLATILLLVLLLILLHFDCGLPIPSLLKSP